MQRSYVFLTPALNLFLVFTVLSSLHSISLCWYTSVIVIHMHIPSHSRWLKTLPLSSARTRPMTLAVHPQ